MFIIFFFYPSTRISSTTRHPSRAWSPSPGSPFRSPRPSSRESCKPLEFLGSSCLCVYHSSFSSSPSSPLLGTGQSARLPIPSCLLQAPRNSSPRSLGGAPSRSTTLPVASTAPPSELSATVRHSFERFFFFFLLFFFYCSHFFFLMTLSIDL